MDKLERTIDAALAYVEHKAGALRRPNGRWLSKQEKRLERKIKKRFDRQMEWTVKNMENLTFFQNRQENSVQFIERKFFKDEIVEFLDDMPEHENIAGDITKTAQTSFLRGAKTSFSSLAMAEAGVSFDLINVYAVQYLQRLRSLHLSDYRGSIKQTTKKRIIAILLDAAETGESYTSAAQKIRKLAVEGVFSRSRAELIATHEVGDAYETGNYDMVDAYRRETMASIQKTWITVGDDRVTQTHTKNQADGWIPYEASFSGTADKHPPASDNPRCRCTLGYRRVDLNNQPIE